MTTLAKESSQTRMGLAAEFHGLDRGGMRSVLMAKLQSGFEEVQQGRVVDGDGVFDRLRERLVQMGSSLIGLPGIVIRDF